MKERDPHDLRLHEQVLLLLLRDDKGTVESRAGMYRIALGAALLSELLLEQRISVATDKKKLVDLVERKPLGDPVLEEALGRLAAAKRRRSATRWIQSFAGIKRLRHRIALQLCRRRILRDSEDTVLLLFTRKVYPTIDPAPERHLVQQMRQAIFGGGATVEPRIAILIALAHSTGLLRVHFDRRELKRRKERLERITRGDVIGGAAREVVQAAQAATATAITAAAAAAAASSASR